MKPTAILRFEALAAVLSLNWRHAFKPTIIIRKLTDLESRE